MTDITKGELYRRFAKITTNYQEHHILLMSDHSYDTRHHIWLCLIGLIETWDIVK